MDRYRSRRMFWTDLYVGIESHPARRARQMVSTTNDPHMHHRTLGASQYHMREISGGTSEL